MFYWYLFINILKLKIFHYIVEMCEIFQRKIFSQESSPTITHSPLLFFCSDSIGHKVRNAIQFHLTEVFIFSRFEIKCKLVFLTSRVIVLPPKILILSVVWLCFRGSFMFISFSIYFTKEELFVRESGINF